MNYWVRLTIFVVAAVLAAAVFLFVFLRGPLKRYAWRHHTVRMFYKKIHQVALDYDFYLINNLVLKVGDDDFVHIDHVLLGDKFIYVIKDRYYEGAVSAKENDPSWIYYGNFKEKKYFDNPMRINKIRLERLSISSGIKPAFLISLVVVNDDCFVTPFINSSKDSYLVSLSRLGKLIGSIEERPVPPFTPEALKQTANDLHELNANEKR